MVRFLIFGRTDDAVMVAAFVIVGLGEGTGIAEAEPVACRRDRKRATETVTIAAIEGRELSRQYCFARFGEPRCLRFAGNSPADSSEENTSETQSLMRT